MKKLIAGLATLATLAGWAENVQWETTTLPKVPKWLYGAIATRNPNTASTTYFPWTGGDLASTLTQGDSHPGDEPDAIEWGWWEKIETLSAETTAKFKAMVKHFWVKNGTVPAWDKSYKYDGNWKKLEFRYNSPSITMVVSFSVDSINENGQWLVKMNIISWEDGNNNTAEEMFRVMYKLLVEWYSL